MALPPLGRFLVAGEGHWHEGVAVPELALRLHELPSASEEVYVVGERGADTVAWLIAGGRKASLADEPRIGPETPELPLWRLWRPNAWLETPVEEPVPGRALDIGCGTGRDAVFLASQGWDVCALDHLPDAIDRAKDLQSRYSPESRIEWLVADGHSAPNRQFGLILMLRCYSPSLLRVAIERLSPNGTILLETFTDEYRALTGHPTKAEQVFSEADLPWEAAMNFVGADDKWQRVEIHRR